MKSLTAEEIMVTLPRVLYHCPTCNAPGTGRANGRAERVDCRTAARSGRGLKWQS